MLTCLWWLYIFFFQVTKYKRNFELCSIRTRIHIINFDIDKCTVRILLFGLPKVYIYYLFPMFDEIQSKLCSIGIRIQFKYLLLDKRVISTSDICPSVQYFLFTCTTVKIQRKLELKYIRARFRWPIFDPLSKLLHRRAREKSRALVRPFFVAKPVQGVCVCSVWIRGSPVSAAGGNRFWSGAGEGGRVASRTGFKREQSSVALRGAAWRMPGGGGRSASQPWWGKVGSDKWWFTVIVSPDRAFGEARSLRVERRPLSFHTIDPRFVEPVYQTRLFAPRILSRP